MQEVLDNIILDGVGDITRLINASEMDKNHLRDDKGKVRYYTYPSSKLQIFQGAISNLLLLYSMGQNIEKS